MTARRCFVAKIKTGRVGDRAGRDLLKMVDDFEQAARQKLGDDPASLRKAASDAAEAFGQAAGRKADDLRDTVLHQSDFLQKRVAYEAELKTLRETPGDFGFGTKAPRGVPLIVESLKEETRSPVLAVARAMLFGDPHEIASFGNFFYRAKQLRQDFQREFAEGIDYLQSKMFGFKEQTTRELDVGRALFGRTDVEPQARTVAEVWFKASDKLFQKWIDLTGRTAKIERYVPNVEFDRAKAQALGPERLKTLLRTETDRARMIDFDTGKPMADARYEQLLDQAVQGIMAGGIEGPPSAAFPLKGKLADAREAPRLFVYKDFDAWTRVAEAVGQHSSINAAMMIHVKDLANDIALVEKFGRNPETMKRFITDQIAREPARLSVSIDDMEKGGGAGAVKLNRKIESQARSDTNKWNVLWAEATGANQVPVNSEWARRLSDVRALLASTQLGGAIISSFNDVATRMMTSRFNGLPVMSVIGDATRQMSAKGGEIFAAQMGLGADTLSHGAGQVDRFMGESIRMGLAGKVATGVIRAQGLRAYTERNRHAFGLDMMALVTRERSKAFADIEPQLKESLKRYGIGADEWKIIQAAQAHEPRPNALFVRPADVEALGGKAATAAAESYSRLINTEMDHAVIGYDPISRAFLMGESRPGTKGGEMRRALGMYRQFPLALTQLYFSRAFARGWDGTRLGHAGIGFVMLTAFGVLSMQAKEILAGRDALSLDPTTGNGLRALGKAIIQGSGLGVFGDMLAVDQTKSGNTWASTIAGPMAGSVETILGDFVLKNIQRAGKGEPTSTFMGDALYAFGRHVPGSSLWYAKLPFQRAVLDQLALMLDPKARDRFARIEATAQKDWGQPYWMQPGRLEPRRSPNFSMGLSR